MLSISHLPAVLQDIVVSFAYDKTIKEVNECIDVLLSIRKMRLPAFFTQEVVWSWSTDEFVVNPLVKFEHIDTVSGDYSSLFNFDALYCFLDALDFRKREVRQFGSRREWLQRLFSAWETVSPLSAFFRVILRAKNPTKKRNSVIRRYI